jgi:hypothetical protein
MAELLKTLNPLHIVSIADKVVAVDSVLVEDRRPYMVKRRLALEAIISVFANIEEKMPITFNCELLMHESGITTVCLYMGVLWYLVPSTSATLPRFAYHADVHHGLFPYERIRDSEHVRCYALIEEKPVTEIYVSRRFFLSPKPENAETFGDLCFLAQASKGWTVNRSIKLQTDISIEGVLKVLRSCIGLESLASHGYRELLLGDYAQHWRGLLERLKEGEDGEASSRPMV